MNKRVYIRTFGCQMNKADSSQIRATLKNENYSFADNPESADIIIINTCSVRKNAEDRVFGILSGFKPLKQNNPDLKIIVAGCMAQNVAINWRSDFPYVDFIVGTYNLKKIPELIRGSKSNLQESLLLMKDYDFQKPANEKKYPFKAFLNITHGCDNFCSYCIVPHVRGQQKSKKSELILKEAKDLVQDGVLEITLLGQNVNSFGKDTGDISFPELLKKISAIKGLQRIRFLTSHPKDFSIQLMEAIFSSDNICPHIHLPLQSGSDRILKLMNRQYTIDQYLNIVENIRKSANNRQYSITTDILVGFPGETDTDFEQTLEAVKRIDFDDAYMYKYSDRPETVSCRFESKIPEEEMLARLSCLIELVRKNSALKNSKLAGNVFEVLVEERSKKDKEAFLCRTVTDKTVVCANVDIGKIYSVKITGVKGMTLMGIKL